MLIASALAYKGVKLASVTQGHLKFGFVLALAGAVLAALDIFFTAEKLSHIDKKFWDFIQQFGSGYKNALKNMMIVHSRSPVDMVTWVLTPYANLFVVLAPFSLMPFPSALVIAFLFLMIAPLFIARKNLVVGTACIALGSYYLKNSTNLLHVFEDRTFTCLYVYCMALFTLKIGYDNHAALRKECLYLMWMLGLPFFITTASFRTVPFLISLPIYYMINGLNRLKPTSLLRLVGFVMTLIGMSIN